MKKPTRARSAFQTFEPVRRLAVPLLLLAVAPALAARAAAEGPVEAPLVTPPADTSPPADVGAPPEDAERTPSGLASKVLRPGTGSVHPDANDMVAVHFIGWTPAGALIQNSYAEERHTVFNLAQVFSGWAEGLQLMVEGEKRRLWIPDHLGPQNPTSGPKGAAVFDVELLGIKSVPNPPAELAKPPENAERTPSGAYTRKVADGHGEAHPGAESPVLMNYTLWTADGKTFDSTVTRNRPTLFPLDKVMPPFAEVVRMMVEGEKRQIWIPENVAAGQWPKGPKGDLIFEVELIQIMPDDILTEKPDVPPQSG